MDQCKSSPTSSTVKWLAFFSPLLSGVCSAVLYKARSCSWWQAVGLLCTSVVYYVCYHGVVDAARMGVPGGIYFDLMVVTLVAQFVATFSSYGWYILLLVSGRGTYSKYVKYTCIFANPQTFFFFYYKPARQVPARSSLPSLPRYLTATLLPS